MSEMTSFYGGRQGSPFIVVKTFDGIDIEQKEGAYVYTGNFYAVDEAGKFIITSDKTIPGATKVSTNEEKYIIARLVENARSYEWEYHENNGENVDDTSYKFPSELAQGMKQCFQKGSSTATEVNYGEYVLIDTIRNLHRWSSLDNGKVFRRGFNLNDEFGGAEYIGQIVGPKGDVPELDLSYWRDISHRAHRDVHFIPDAGDDQDSDMVAGSYLKLNEETGEYEREFNDEVYLAWATVYDVLGNITGTEFGFHIPTLVEDYEANSITPYEHRKVGEKGIELFGPDSIYTQLIVEDEDEYKNKRWQHPFYEKWQISIPYGYHGTGSENLEIIPTKTRPKETKGTTPELLVVTYPGCPVYNDAACTDPYIVDGKALVLEIPQDIMIDEEYRFWEQLTDYAVGDKISFYHYDDPEKKEGGKRNLYHCVTAHKSGAEFEEGNWLLISEFPIYNADPLIVSAKINMGTAVTPNIKYVKKVDCYMDVMRYKETDYNRIIEGDVNYINLGYANTIKRVKLEDDGYLWVYYSSIADPQRLDQNPIRWIDDIEIEVAKEGDIEGSGDQKIHLTYNLKDEQGERVKDVIGNPLNYIIESCICKPTPTYPDAPYSHLLCYFSDPVLREQNKSKWVTYPSTKIVDSWSKAIGQHTENALHVVADGTTPVPAGSITLTEAKKLVADAAVGDYLEPTYHVLTEWVDMGNVLGEPGGIHIIKNVTNLNELIDPNTGKGIPPEKIEHNGTIAANAAGWNVTYKKDSESLVEIHAYDYDLEKWYYVGILDSRPDTILVASPAVSDTKLPNPQDVKWLREFGYWLGEEPCKFAE